MVTKLRARQGDTLDALLSRELSLGIDGNAGILAANPGLADLGPVLPIGTAVSVPATQTAPTTPALPLVQLWD